MTGKLSSTPRRKLKQSTLLDFSSPTKQPTDSPEPVPSSSKSRKRKKPKIKPSGSVSPRKSLQLKIPVNTPQSSRKKKRKSPTLSVTDSEGSSEDISRIKLESKEPINVSSDSSSSSEDESEEEDVPRPTQAKRIQRLKELVESEPEEEQQEEEAPPRRSTRAATKRRRKQVEVSEEGSEKEAATPKRRRLTRVRKATAVANSGSEEEDEEEELDQKYVLKSRLRERGKKTAFQKNLEKLKKLKQKQPLSSSSSEEEGESEESKVAKPFKGAKRGGSLFGTSEVDEDEDMNEPTSDSDFIVEDEGLGAPLLPAEYSMETHQDLSHQFKKIFQFFVHIAVQPPKKRKKFMQTNMEGKRKLAGLRDSLVASSVWRPQFKKALERFPQFSLTSLAFTVPECDACHLGRRVSTLCGRLDGEPYDRVGFQLLKGEDESSDTDSDEKSLKKEFNLGRFCGRRTHVYHQFSHWEYGLFKSIDSEIEDLRAMQTKKKGKKQFYRVAYAGGKQPPEDLTDADELVEWMDERKIIEREWQIVKTMMESARHLEMEGKRDNLD
ncbi:hypothetical protein D9611_004714 [Ephemerocybe angulata]|uniref:DUF4211 domain-containing protein n=1 Tax=Ephemerocybe angulata TaxID=980116 RepID=A0A8H5B2L0_9AGAR|nr:hypothetical protein D9611_004714 [Tulosesus angulatus]